MAIFKRREFARWQKMESLSDSALCKAVKEIKSGLFDANLGGCLYKKRIARSGSGKSSGFRTILSARLGHRYVFLHGFTKNEKANITHSETTALQFTGKLFLGMHTKNLAIALQTGVLLEVNCDKQDH